MSGHSTVRSSEVPQAQSLVSFDSVAQSIGTRIAQGILARIESFPKREERLGWKSGQMDSLPEDILWEGLGEESAPIFVVYKLLHEAFSNAPQLFRAAMVEFMRAQPKRFSAVFDRETIWAVLAAFVPPCLISQKDLFASNAVTPKISVASIAEYLTSAQRKGIWWRSEEEIEREARTVFEQLSEKVGGIGAGLEALRSMQTEKARGISAGNVLLPVPARLAAYADEIVSLGRRNSLPKLNEIYGRVDEIARDPVRDARHVSIPLDLLYTTMEDDLLHVRILARAKANASERAEIRRRSLYLRYFLRKAFTGYPPEQIDLRLAFYLDSGGLNYAWSGDESLFHKEELMLRDEFWNDLCPGAAPEALFAQIRKAATEALTKQKVVEKLKTHFARTNRKPKSQ